MSRAGDRIHSPELPRPNSLEWPLMSERAAWIAALLSALTGGTPLHAAGPVDYLRDVKPILSARCYGCHGAVRQKGGLRLDTAELARRGGDSGPAFTAGRSAD